MAKAWKQGVAIISEALPQGSLNAAKGFATSAGNCHGCGKRYREGEAVFTDEHGDTKADMCCGPAPDDRHETFELPETRAATWDDEDAVDPKTVMPRGRTASDLCPGCFQIPSSSGACGCF